MRLPFRLLLGSTLPSPAGALATDSLRIRTWDRSRTEAHRYGLAMAYDAAGRLSALEHPRNLTGNQPQADQFRYNPVTGAVDTVISRIGLRFDYERDYLGRVVRDSSPGGWNSYTYDLEGRRIGREGAYRETTTYDARGKVSSVRINDASYSYNHYSGLGHLVATEWVNINNFAVQVEEFQLDALGHTVWTRSADGDDGGNHPEYGYTYEPGTSRVATIYNQVLPRYSYVDTLDFARDTTYRTYDASGNVEMGWKRSWRGSQVKVQTRSYWGADGRLRAQEEYHETNGTPYLLHERRGYFSEYRYDPLGRRVMVRTRRDGLCYKSGTTIADCTGGITRYIWSGDNLLWEMRGPGADSTFPGNLDDISDNRAEFGVVGYTHAGGVDRPLAVWKGMGANPSVVVVPHMNWRGLFGRGTNSSGGATTVAIEWPGFQTTAYHSVAPSQESTTNWMGSLIDGQRDPGGGMYMRNRYYDPATGQFTQTDPIGIAGGLNTYGFAAGDPVTYSDPYGLSADDCGIGKNKAPCENPDADGDAPPHEVGTLSSVTRLDAQIKAAAAASGVDGDLIRAIMYVETTHGYYDEALAWFDKDSSIRPMNVNPAVWSGLGYSRTDLRDPAKNVMAGAQVLATIIGDLPTGSSVAQIATRYNAGANAAVVNDYGARVARVYETKPWIFRPRGEGNSSIPGGWRN